MSISPWLKCTMIKLLQLVVEANLHTYETSPHIFQWLWFSSTAKSHLHTVVSVWHMVFAPVMYSAELWSTAMHSAHACGLYHRYCSCTNACRRYKEEQKNWFTIQPKGPTYNSYMPTNWHLWRFKPLGTQALLTLEPHDISLRDTFWSAFHYYLEFWCIYTPTCEQQIRPIQLMPYCHLPWN